MRPLGRFRLRRQLLTSSLLSGGLGLLALFRRVAAAPGPMEATRQATADPTPATLPVPVILPGIAVTPATRGEEIPANSWFEIGRSLQDAPIRALRLGSGPVHLALMGSIHGGWERNLAAIKAVMATLAAG